MLITYNAILSYIYNSIPKEIETIVKATKYRLENGTLIYITYLYTLALHIVLSLAATCLTFILFNAIFLKCSHNNLFSP